MTSRGRHEASAWSYGSLARVPRKTIGIYAFWFRHTGRCIYVGQTSEQTIKARLRQHWQGSHSGRLRLWMDAYGEYLDICYASVARNRIRTVERRLIRLWKPEANVQHKK